MHYFVFPMLTFTRELLHHDLSMSNLAWSLSGEEEKITMSSAYNRIAISSLYKGIPFPVALISVTKSSRYKANNVAETVSPSRTPASIVNHFVYVDPTLTLLFSSEYIDFTTW